MIARRALIALTVAALGLTACSGEKETADSTAPASSTATSSSAPAPASTTSALDSPSPTQQESDSIISTEGFRQLRFGMTGQQLIDLGLAKVHTEEGCKNILAAGDLDKAGVTPGFLTEPTDKVFLITASKPGVTTRDGAEVGMTRAQVETIYGDRVGPVPEGSTMYVDALIIDGPRSMWFIFENNVLTRIDVYDYPALKVHPMGSC